MGRGLGACGAKTPGVFSSGCEVKPVLVRPPPLDPLALGVQPSIRAAATVVEPTVNAIAFVVEPTINAVATVIEPSVDAIAFVVEPAIDAVAFVIETLRKTVSASRRGTLRTPIQP